MKKRAEKYPPTEEMVCPSCGRTFTPNRKSWRDYINSGREKVITCSHPCASKHQKGKPRKGREEGDRGQPRLYPNKVLSLSDIPRGYGVPEEWRYVG